MAASDVNGDGYAEIVTGAGPGGGRHARVFDGHFGKMVSEFYAYAPDFRGGVNVAAGELTGDRKAEVVTGPGIGGGPHVRIFDGLTGREQTASSPSTRKTATASTSPSVTSILIDAATLSSVPPPAPPTSASSTGKPSA